jgi:threonine/homoserine/homoserine lactone efflux protein
MLDYLLKGLVVGFIFAIPVGSVGVLCVQRTLTRGRLVGLVSGVGAALADAVFAAIAAFGLTFVHDYLISAQTGLRMGGGVLVIAIGIRSLMSRPPRPEERGNNRRGLPGAFISIFLLTMTNPVNLVGIAAIFGALGAVSEGAGVNLLSSLVLGVFIGSACIWLALASVSGVFRHRLSHQALLWVNRVSGVLLIVLGLFLLTGVGVTTLEEKGWWESF